MVPANLLLVRVRIVSFVRVQREGGILPVRELDCASRVRKLTNPLIEDGIFPVSLFVPK